ncbi:MAG: SUMF1/EgtB/PvdO family nonheme iron enzyme [Planctomycetaceae bacterium]|nr:SUMF1/EgtB/PvdO family nonheme iron enzyme [Planctomycetaceae bacterium]
MPKLFISYRREDSAYPSHAIYKHLAEHYGHDSVMFDVDSIPLGVDFVEYLNEKVSQCDALLVIIGGSWVDACSENGTRRLDDPDDFVRVEVYSALKMGIPVIPVLVDRASMPRADDLPPSLKPLSRRNAAEVRPGRDYQSHLELLVRGLDRVFEHAAATSGKKEKAATPAMQQESTETAETVTTPAPANPKSPEAAKKTEEARLPQSIETGGVITNSIGMELKLIPAGEFMMGSPDTDKDSRRNERPQHRVRITQPFYMGINLVTQREYEQVMGDNPATYNGEDQRPVETITWHDAVKFCNKLSELDGLDQFYDIDIDSQNVSVIGGTGHRLPTEAEWEYACRAGTSTKWSCGDDTETLSAAAWYGRELPDGTRLVGEGEPNQWGLYDMHGNVWEWCWDLYKRYGQTSMETNLTPLGENRRALRGGSFQSSASLCRSAIRGRVVPDHRDPFIGFRVSRSCLRHQEMSIKSVANRY